jgi:hypothetical protein
LLGEWIHCASCDLVLGWWRVLACYAIRIAFFFVAALLSVPGFRHVGAQGFYMTKVYGITAMMA